MKIKENSGNINYMDFLWNRALTRRIVIRKLKYAVNITDFDIMKINFCENGKTKIFVSTLVSSNLAQSLIIADQFKEH
jgi:hypothetical protein